jgi:hypothetical protein
MRGMNGEGVLNIAYSHRQHLHHQVRFIVEVFIQLFVSLLKWYLKDEERII